MNKQKRDQKGRFEKGSKPWNTGMEKEELEKYYSNWSPGGYFLGKKHKEESRKKISDNNSMKREEIRKKVSESQKGNVVSEERRKKISETLKRKNSSGELDYIREKIKISLKKPEVREKISKGNKGKKRTQEQKINSSIKSKKLWLNPEYRNKVIVNSLKALFENRPTSLEKQMINIIQKHNLPYKYTGDGSFLIGYKNPDFINTNGEKIAIEVFHDYFKIKGYGSIENYKIKRNKLFSQYGWRTIFFCDDEVNERNVLQTLEINGGELK